MINRTSTQDSSMSDELTVQVPVRMTAEMYGRVALLATAADRPIAYIIRQAIDSYLQEVDNG